MAESQLHKPFFSSLDTIVWYFFLVIVASVSFFEQGFASRNWLLASAGIFCLLALHLFSIVFGVRHNQSGLKASKVASFILVSSLLLLSLQLIMPYTTAIHELRLSNELAPAWYQPATVWSIVPQETQWLLLSEVVMFVVFLLTISLLTNRRRVKQLLVVFVCVGFIHAIVGCLAKFTSLSLVDLKQIDGHYSAARGWFINRNHFASFLSITLLGTMTFYLKDVLRGEHRSFASTIISQLTSLKVLFLLAWSISVIAIILSQSRAGFLGLVIAFGLGLFLLRKRKVKLGSPYIIIATMGIILTVMLLYFGGDLMARLVNESFSLGERGEQWAVTLKAIQKEWLLGYGGNSYATVFQIEREYTPLRQVWYDQSHNDYLHIWLEQGVVGLLLWLSLMAVTLKRAYHYFLSSSSTLVAASMLAIGLVMIAALLQAFVDFNLQIPNIRSYFFIILAMVYAVPTIRHRKRVQ